MGQNSSREHKAPTRSTPSCYLSMNIPAQENTPGAESSKPRTPCRVDPSRNEATGMQA